MKDNILKYVIAIFIGIFFSILIFRIDFLQRTELFFYNLRFEFKKDNKINSEIVIINIETETIKKYNSFVPYSQYAKLINILSNAKIVGFDIPLTQYTSPDDMNTLSEALKKNQNVILSSQFIGGFFQYIENGITYIPPITNFSQYAQYGYQNYIPDIDGYVRRVALYYAFKQQSTIEESFSYVIAKKISGKDLKDNNHIYLINYKGKSGKFKNYSFQQVIDNPDKFIDIFKDKVVIVGSDFDTYKIPYVLNNKMTSSELHANNISTILDDNEIKKANILINAFVLFLLIGLGGFIARFYSRKKGGTITTIAVFTYILINFLIFDLANIYLNIILPCLGLIISFVLTKYYIYDYKNRELLRLRKIFRPYLAPQMIDDLIKKKDYIDALKGERRVVTVMFADIADFTVLSERLPTDEVVKILNEFLTHMTNIIFANNGTLDKYTGDGVMAVFGNIGKIEAKENARRAVKTSIEMRNELEILQTKWISAGLMPLQIRIGISTGEAIVGNIGSPQQMDLTVIGDTVNTASRLEELNKKFNTTTLISKNTYEYVKDEVKVKSLGEASLKGKNQKVEIYEILGWK